MEILINNNNEITDYAFVGGFEKGIEINDIPKDFVKNFKPKYYLLNEGQIKINKNYKEENELFTPINSLSPNNLGTDKELRDLFANMQVQLVQANTMVMQLFQQNARLSQELVRINQVINSMKEVDKDENVVPEV